MPEPMNNADHAVPEWTAVCDRLGLSPREREIAMGVLIDEKELRIAQRLGISPHTVHTHTERLYHKLGVSSRVQLVVRLADERCGMCRRGDACGECARTPEEGCGPGG